MGTLVLIGFQITTKRLCHFDQVDKKTDGQFREMPEMRLKLTPNFLHNVRRVALAVVTRHQLLLHNPCHQHDHWSSSSKSSSSSSLKCKLLTKERRVWLAAVTRRGAR